MGHREVVECYYNDLNNLVDILTKLVSSYRLLIGGAHELNEITPAKKNQVKKVLNKIDELGKIIDDVLEVLEDVSYSYTDYCKIKSEVIRCKIQVQYIETEIDNELKLQNSKEDK